MTSNINTSTRFNDHTVIIDTIVIVYKLSVGRG